MWTKLKLWIAYKLGVGTLLAKPDVALLLLLKKFSDEDFAQWAGAIKLFMTKKVGIERWKKVAKILAKRIKKFLEVIENEHN